MTSGKRNGSDAEIPLEGLSRHLYLFGQNAGMPGCRLSCNGAEEKEALRRRNREEIMTAYGLTSAEYAQLATLYEQRNGPALVRAELRKRPAMTVV